MAGPWRDHAMELLFSPLWSSLISAASCAESSHSLSFLSSLTDEVPSYSASEDAEFDLVKFGARSSGVGNWVCEEQVCVSCFRSSVCGV
ncbi:hypothetical protein KC19_12G090000 [Ceratodon purpureus]|uniref:Secreted protein n=1 Tax=Ceratodon purpureus TaxID=3225 RepID=A0A8T0G559_CERPU|nr:hypothetical protein KC19_12G090000 [Ceratodon purpureus]